MILAVVFCAFTLIGIIRLAVFALYTSRHHNSAGAAMLWTFAFIIFACAVLAVIRL